MTFFWPSHTRESFGKTLIEASHTLHADSHFQDDGLAELLDEFPREHLGIYCFAPQSEERVEPAHGRADGISGRDLLDAVKRGHIWLNLRDASRHLVDYDNLCDDLFDQLEVASGRHIFKRDLGVLISSPNVNVQYHLDIPLVLLVQIRGRKRVWLYPTDEQFASSEHIEAISLRETEEDLPFQAGFDAHAKVVDLEPGMAITWPQAAPHRVQNADVLNVSLSCEFMTLPALIHANAIHANAILRRKAGWHPRRPDGVTPGTLAKAGLSRMMKLVHRPAGTPNPAPQFVVDPDAETGVRLL
ncbi:MAG: hypothetical protein MRY64_16285 [Hyphomonadaceae bacterium]|nr:hypothetical protein [Hyphomonadaceae bacterium]